MIGYKEAKCHLLNQFIASIYNQSFSVMFLKVLYVTVLLYLYSYSFSSPRRRFVLHSEISGKYKLYIKCTERNAKERISALSLVVDLITRKCLSSLLPPHSRLQICFAQNVGGGGVLPYIGYIGMCSPKGYGFSS